MIIARSKTPSGGQILLLGLSRENINRLTKGQPIGIRRDTHGAGIPEGWEICIMFGETEEAMEKELKAAGLIGPETGMHTGHEPSP